MRGSTAQGRGRGRRDQRRVAWALSALAWAAAGTAGVAHAHPLLDEARERYEAAEFEAAEDALSRADAAEGMTFEEAEQLLELRILVQLGLGNEDAADRDLRRLLVMSPTHRFSDAVPPEVIERAQALRADLPGAVRIVASARQGPAGLTVRAEVDGDDAGVVRRVRVGARAGEGSYRVVDRASLELPGVDRAEFFAEALGPGGAVVATDGTREEPRRHGGTASEGGVPWLFIGVGAGAAAVAATLIVLVIALSGGESDQTRLGLPVVSLE